MQGFSPSRELYPFKSRWLNSSVGRVHFIDEGAGAPILFLHGNPTWSFLYRHIVKNLRDRFRCVAVDYPGFGLSVRPDGYGYTPREHSAIVGELVEHLGLDDFVVMVQDWGGPIGLNMAASKPERIRGLVIGNTWFWPEMTGSTKAFVAIMSSSFIQRQILEKNLFVERVMPFAMDRKLTREEMDHYRNAQPTPEARKGVAEFPKQIKASRPWLAELAEAVPRALGNKPVLIPWGMRDMGFKPKPHLERVAGTFSDRVVLQLPQAKHYIQEDAPEEISRAIADRFGKLGSPAQARSASALSNRTRVPA